MSEMLGWLAEVDSWEGLKAVAVWYPVETATLFALALGVLGVLSIAAGLVGVWWWRRADQHVEVAPADAAVFDTGMARVGAE